MPNPEIFSDLVLNGNSGLNNPLRVVSNRSGIIILKLALKNNSGCSENDDNQQLLDQQIF